MIKTKVYNINKVLTAMDKQLSQISTHVSNTILQEARKNTPIKQGRARSGWKVSKLGNTVRVQNRVPYIDLLEKGRSKQAPRGILKPTIRGLKNRRKLYE